MPDRKINFCSKFAVKTSSVLPLLMLTLEVQSLSIRSFKNVWEKVYFRSQILERPSIGEYWNISGAVLPENVIFTFFGTCWCYSEAYNTGTQKWSSIVQYSCTSIWDFKYTFSKYTFSSILFFFFCLFFIKPFLTNRWRHFGRRYWAEIYCLMLNYLSKDYHLWVFQKSR